MALAVNPDDNATMARHRFVRLSSVLVTSLEPRLEVSPQVESFFKTLKYEEVYLSEYETFKDALDRLPNFIKEVYNRINPEGLILKEKTACVSWLYATVGV